MPWLCLCIHPHTPSRLVWSSWLLSVWCLHSFMCSCITAAALFTAASLVYRVCLSALGPTTQWLKPCWLHLATHVSPAHFVFACLFSCTLWRSSHYSTCPALTTSLKHHSLDAKATYIMGSMLHLTFESCLKDVFVIWWWSFTQLSVVSMSYFSFSCACHLLLVIPSYACSPAFLSHSHTVHAQCVRQNADLATGCRPFQTTQLCAIVGDNSKGCLQRMTDIPQSSPSLRRLYCHAMAICVVYGNSESCHDGKQMHLKPALRVVWWWAESVHCASFAAQKMQKI